MRRGARDLLLAHLAPVAIRDRGRVQAGSKPGANRLRPSAIPRLLLEGIRLLQSTPRRGIAKSTVGDG